jgi:hypothetical protein
MTRQIFFVSVAGLLILASVVCGWPLANNAKDIRTEIKLRDLSMRLAFAGSAFGFAGTFV